MNQIARIPEFKIHAKKNLLSLQGRSIPEDPRPYYNDITEKAKSHLESMQAACTLEIHLDYFNTASALYLYQFLRFYQEKSSEGSIIRWCYDKGDADILEAGKDYEEMLDIEFEFQEKTL